MHGGGFFRSSFGPQLFVFNRWDLDVQAYPVSPEIFPRYFITDRGGHVHGFTGSPE